MRPTLTILGAYLLAAAFLFAFMVIDLWAKSFDFPTAQRIAKLALAVDAAITFGAFSLLASGLLQRSSLTFSFWILAALLAVPFAVLVRSLNEVDLRGVYLAAVLASGAAWFVGSRTDARLAQVVGVSNAVVLLVAAWSELPRARFTRYVHELEHACSCCGQKQRAVHELAYMGRRGEEAIVRFMASPAGRDGRVIEEWRRCRPTKG